MLMPFAFTLALAAGPADCTGACASALLQSARSFVASRKYPARIAYEVRVTLRKPNGIEETRTYRSAYDVARNVVYTKSISIEEQAAPVTPRGTNVAIGFLSNGIGSRLLLGRPASDPDVIGVPLLSPTYAFGLGRGTVARPAVAPGDLAEIGHVTTTSADYEVTYLDDDDVAGEPCRHLSLVPRSPSPKARLREMWVAQSDGAPLKARLHGNFTSRPWDGLTWTVTFRRAGDALYIGSETTEQIVRIDGHREGRVAVEFRNVAEKEFQNEFLLNLIPRHAVREP